MCKPVKFLFWFQSDAFCKNRRQDTDYIGYPVFFINKLNMYIKIPDSIWQQASSWAQVCFIAIRINKAKRIYRATPMSGIAMVTTQLCLMSKCVLQIHVHNLWNAKSTYQSCYWVCRTSTKLPFLCYQNYVDSWYRLNQTHTSYRFVTCTFMMSWSTTFQVYWIEIWSWAGAHLITIK